MPANAVSREECEKVVALIEKALKQGFKAQGGQPSAIGHIAREMGVDRRKIEHRLAVAQSKYSLGLHIPSKRTPLVITDAFKHRVKEEIQEVQPTLPDLPDDDIPDDEIIDLMCRRYSKRAEHRAAKKWFKIQMPDDKPFGIMWWGDPHLDSNGTNWPLLKEHAELAKTPGIYSVNIGDTLDNWPHASRLIRLYAHSDTSVETARKLARWFLKASGIRWLVWLLGNHDSWSGHTSTDWLREVGGKSLAMEDWGAKFILACPSHEFRVHASHDFPGHSQWNSLHGPQKKAMLGEEADVYVCGHKHNWAIHREENAERGFTYSIVRARGYKFIDDHADKLGYASQQHGASVLSVFIPQTGRHYNFEHPEDGIRFLKAVRNG